MKEERKKERERERERERVGNAWKIGQIALTIVYKCLHVLFFQSVWKENINKNISHLISKIFSAIIVSIY